MVLIFSRKFHGTYMKNCFYVKNVTKYKISGKNRKISGEKKKMLEKIRHFHEKSKKMLIFLSACYVIKISKRNVLQNKHLCSLLNCVRSLKIKVADKIIPLKLSNYLAGTYN